MGDTKKMKGFVNPYNFICFPKEKAHAYADEDRHTGVIHYTITTKTPLFIPNSSSETAFTESGTPDHKSCDFFSYTELDPTKKYEDEYHIPVIPGSEMRGVVRNVYETLTDSCMSVLNTDTYPVKRSPERFAPALLHRDHEGNWELLPALSLRIGLGEDAHWETTKKGKKIRRATKPPKNFESFHNGTTVYYQKPEQNEKGSWKAIEQYSDEPGKYTNYGYLLKWGMGVAKLHYHVFAVQKNKPAISELKISRDIVERKMLPVLESYLDQPALIPHNKAAYEEYANDLKRFLNGKEEAYFPVTYSQIGNRGIFYLAPAIFSKEVSNQNLDKLAGKFRPCKEDFCPACDLFGSVGTNNENAKGSKIRFSDLYPEKYDQIMIEWKEPEQITDLKKDEQKKTDINQKIKNAFYLEKNNGKVTLQALAEPKLGNVEFYLKKPDEKAEFWTYDYYTTRDEYDDGRGQTHLYTASGKNCQLRGRKYYWHHRKVDISQEIEKTKLNKTIRPVKSGVTFEGELYFEGISKRQLNQLLWILDSSEQVEGKTPGLKLGGVKPLGYGSVVCNVTSVEERTFLFADNVLSYQMEKKDRREEPDWFHISYGTDSDNGKGAGFSEEVKEAFFKIADIHAVPEGVEITYPKTWNQKDKPLTEGFRWFGQNHGTLSGKGMPKNRADVTIKKVLPDILEEDVSLPYNLNPNYQNQKKRNS